MKSSKNKTIDVSLENNRENYEKCLQISKKIELNNITNKTIIGDTMKTLPLLPGKFVDLLIVDPPYNLTKNYHGNKFSKRNTEEYYEFTKRWVEKVLPILKDEATVYVCCDWASSQIIFNVLNEFFYIQNRITWQREKGRGAKTNWKNGMEDIWFATVSKKYYFDVNSVKQRKTVVAPYKKEGKPKDWIESEEGNFRDTHPSNLWDDITIPYWSMKENTQHPTQKPEKLVAKLILASTKRGDFVFDPFLGSGTTSVVAKKLGRKFSGIEMNPLYASWAELRLSQTFSGDEIQGYSQGVFWSRNSLSQQKKVPFYQKNPS